MCENIKYSDSLFRDDDNMFGRDEIDGQSSLFLFLAKTNGLKIEKLKDTILSSDKGLFKSEKTFDEIFKDSNIVISVSSKKTSAYFEIFLSLQKTEDKNGLKSTIDLSHSPLIFKPFCTSDWIEELIEGLNFEFSE